MKFMNRCIFIVMFGFTFFMMGCFPMYRPNAVHSPMLTAKGEGHISASVGVAGCGVANLQADYAPSNHIGVMINSMYHNPGFTNLKGEKLNILFAEVGVGYFTKFSQSKRFSQNTRPLFQIYGGAGYGKSKLKILDEGNPNPELTSGYNNIFIQPGLVIPLQHAIIAVDFRFNYIKVNQINSIRVEEFRWWDKNLTFAADSSWQYALFEPTYTMTVGNKNLKFNFQCGLAFPLTFTNVFYGESNPPNVKLADIYLLKWNMGIIYAFGKK